MQGRTLAAQIVLRHLHCILNIPHAFLASVTEYVHS
jgi:hypothetical protein